MDAKTRLDALLGSAPIVHFVFDRAGVVTLDEGSYGVLGAPRSAVGRSVLTDFPALPWLAAQARRALGGETFVETMAIGDAWVLMRYIPVRDAGGAVGQVIVFGIDVTERRRREQALADSEERYRHLAEATFEAIAVHDGRRILDANTRMAEMFGYRPEELLAMGPLELATPESRPLVAGRIANGYQDAYEATGRRKDGSTFVGELRSKQMTYQGRPVRITAIRDVTARRRAEEQRDELLARAEAARATAEAALSIRDEFMSIAAHELNSPLTTLKLRVEQLAHLVRDLLDVTRIRSGQLAIERGPVDLVELVREVVARQREELQRARSTVEVQAPATLVGQWDRGRLDQVVVNLLSNAMKYGAGQPITITVEGDEAEARLAVRDRGMGIAPDQLDKVFDRFSRTAPARALGGLGLGLYIVKQIVVAHGGRVRVESAPGQGARFEVVLPR